MNLLNYNKPINFIQILLLFLLSIFGDIFNYIALFLLNPPQRIFGFLFLIITNVLSLIFIYINQFVKLKFLAYLSVILNVSLRFIYPSAAFWLINIVGFSKNILFLLSLFYLSPFLILLLLKKNQKILSFFKNKSVVIILFIIILLILPSRWELRFFDLSFFEKNIFLLRAILGSFLIPLWWDLRIFPIIIEVVESADD